MECCVNALVTSFKETILAECQGMIKRNETESKWSFKNSTGWTQHHLHKNRFVCRYIKLLFLIDGGSVSQLKHYCPWAILSHKKWLSLVSIFSYSFWNLYVQYPKLNDWLALILLERKEYFAFSFLYFSSNLFSSCSPTGKCCICLIFYLNRSDTNTPPSFHPHCLLPPGKKVKHLFTKLFFLKTREKFFLFWLLVQDQ